MATLCPKCGYRLRLRDWKAECPACGVNMLFYRRAERDIQGILDAELEHAAFQAKIDPIKSATIGGKYAIARFVSLFLPIGPLFLPLVRMDVNGGEGVVPGKAASILSFVGHFFNGGFSGLRSQPALLVAFVCLALVVPLILAQLLCVIFANHPGGRARSLLLAGAGSLLSLGLLLSLSLFSGPQPGTLLLPVVFLAIFGLQFYIYKTNAAPTVHTPCYVEGILYEDYLARREEAKWNS